MRKFLFLSLIVLATTLAMCFPAFTYEYGHDSTGDHSGTHTDHAGELCDATHHSTLCYTQRATPEDVVMHMMHPALPANCPVDWMHDGVDRPLKLEHHDQGGNLVCTYLITYVGGRVSRVEQHGPGGELICYTVCSYNSNGKLVRTENVDAYEFHTGHTSYTYNTAGKLSRAMTYEGSIFSHELRCTYNSAGRLGKVCQYNAGGYMEWYRSCQYNTSGKLASSVVCSPSGTVLESKRCTYDSAGRLQTVREYHPDGTMIGYCSYLRNTTGVLTTTRCFTPANTSLGYVNCIH